MKIFSKKVFLTLGILLAASGMTVAANQSYFLKADLTNNVGYNCDVIEKKIQNGQTVTMEEKFWHEKNCKKTETTTTQNPSETQCREWLEKSLKGNAEARMLYAQLCNAGTPATPTTNATTTTIQSPGLTPLTQCEEWKTKATKGDVQARELYGRFCGTNGSTNVSGNGDRGQPTPPPASPTQCEELRMKAANGNKDAKALFEKLCQPKNSTAVTETDDQSQPTPPVTERCTELKAQADKGNMDAANLYSKLCSATSSSSTTTTTSSSTSTTTNSSTSDTTTNFTSLNAAQCEILKSQAAKGVEAARKVYDFYCTNKKPENPAKPTDNRKPETTSEEDPESKDETSVVNCEELKKKISTSTVARVEYDKVCSQKVDKVKRMIKFMDKVSTSVDRANNPCQDLDNRSERAVAFYELTIRGAVGCKDKKANAEKPVTRAEIAKIFSIVRDGTTVKDGNEVTKEDERTRSQFKDLPADEWYSKYVIQLTREKAFTGYNNGTIRPEKNVTTAEFLKVFTTFFKLEQKLSHEYKDVASTDWFAPYAGVAAKYKLFTYSESPYLLVPGHQLTKGEIVEAMYRFLALRDQK